MEIQENTLNKVQILDWYTDDVLSEKKPTNVYSFTKKHNISEGEFYNFFSDLKAIESYFFIAIFDATVQTLHSSEDYPEYPAKDKWLSFYFTFFENLKINRSFVQYALRDTTMKNYKVLKDLRVEFLRFAKEIDSNIIDFKQKDINKVQNMILDESAWVHFLGTLIFWLNDDSAGFEKTDVFIEKSLNAGFDVINIDALKNVKDFGKFMLKEILPTK